MMSQTKRFYSRAPGWVLMLFTALLLVVMSCNIAFADVAQSSDTGGRAIDGNSILKGNRMYHLNGIKYWLYTDANATAVAKDSKQRDAVITLDANGNTVPIDGVSALELIPGNYWAKEDASSVIGTGYKYHNEIYPLNVTSANRKENPLLLNVVDEPYTVAPKLTKIGRYDKEIVGDTQLNGAVYKVKYYGRQVSLADIQNETANANINTSTGDRIWYVKTENNSSGEPGHIDFLTTNIIGVGNVSTNVEVFNPVTGTKITKNYSSNSDYKDTSNKRVFLLGTYYVEEVDPPEGYRVNTSNTSNGGEYQNKFYTYIDDATARANNNMGTYGWTMRNPNIEIRGGITVRKHNNQTGYDERGDTRQDATYAIVNRSKSYVYYNGDRSKKIQPLASGTAFDPSRHVANIVTKITAYKHPDGSWIAETPATALDYGTYEVVEVDPMTGGLLDDGYRETVVIHKDGVVQCDHIWKNAVKRGKVRVRKSDKITGDMPNGDTELDATFAIVNASTKFVLHNDDKNVRYQPGDIVTKIKAKKDTATGQWWAETDDLALDYGTYIVYECEPAEGHKTEQKDLKYTRPEYSYTYKNKDGNEVTYTEPAKEFTLKDAVVDGYKPETIHIREHGQVIDLGGKQTFLNMAKYNGLKLLKVDWDERFVPLKDEFDINLGEGDATLLGAEFTITNHSKYPVYVGPINGVQPFNAETGELDAAVKNPDNWKAADGGDVMTITVVAVTDDAVILAYLPERTGTRAVASTEELTYNGKVTGANERLPYGTYNIKETKAPEGYRLDYAGEFWYMNNQHNKLHDKDRDWYIVDGKDLMKYITNLHADIVDPTYRDHTQE